MKQAAREVQASNRHGFVQTLAQRVRSYRMFGIEFLCEPQEMALSLIG